MITRVLFTLVLTLVTVVPCHAAILVQSASGTYTQKATLAEAAVATDVAGKSVIVTTALSAVQSNISSATLHAWPADRTLRVDRGGSIANTTTFRTIGPVNMTGGTFSGTGAVPVTGQFDAGGYQVITGTSTVTGIKSPNPQWWGAVSGSDSTAAYRAAVNCAATAGSAPYKGGTVHVPPGKWIITSTLTANISGSSQVQINFVGDGISSNIDWQGANDSAIINYVGVAYTGTVAMQHVEGIQFTTSLGATGIVPIRLGNTTSLDGSSGICNVVVERCRFNDVGTALELWTESDEVTFQNNHVVTYTTAAVHSRFPSGATNTNNSAMRVINNHIQDGQDGSVAVIAHGAGITITGNVIQATNTTATGILLEDCTGFRISENYSEMYDSPSAGAYWIRSTRSWAGYIGNNITGAYNNSNLIDIDADSHDIEIGPNHHSISGGNPTANVAIASGAVGIRITGKQYTNLAATIITGTPAYLYDGTNTSATGNFTTTGAIGSINTSVNLAASATQTVALPLGTVGWLAVTQATEGLKYLGFVTNFFGTATIYKIMETDVAQMAVGVSAGNLTIQNLVGGTRSIQYNLIRTN